MFMAFCPLQIKSLCASLLDSNVLVQRNNLEIVLFFFPFYTCLVSRLCSSGAVLVFPEAMGSAGETQAVLSGGAGRRSVTTVHGQLISLWVVSP